ncbi:IS200/IS605 family transposase [Lyngbya confervoides]|uniref:IS200/IS605 family transposase n=1 Tax=Lyngbya confervoides TaxID=207921 RepID=UPI00140859B5
MHRRRGDAPARHQSRPEARVLVKNQCILLNCGGEPDHIHLLIDLHPSVAPSVVLGHTKSAVSRVLRKEFESELRPHFKNWNKGLWGDQSFYTSTGGAPIEVLEQYIQNPSRGSGTIKGRKA